MFCLMILKKGYLKIFIRVLIVRVTRFGHELFLALIFDCNSSVLRREAEPRKISHCYFLWTLMIIICSILRSVSCDMSLKNVINELLLFPIYSFHTEEM